MLLLPPISGPSQARRAPSPSPLHFRWHSSNVPGLGRQPQALSSPVPPALAAAVPGVRSEPRPAPAPAPRPPPIGGSVKPGGEGGGGGSPTRGGAGGGGGPAGGELAANTFPMVACKGKGQRAEVKARRLQAQRWRTPLCSEPRFHARQRLPPVCSAPTPCATRNRTRCRRRRHRHHRRPAPPSPLVYRALVSAHQLQCMALLLESWMKVPPTSLERPFLLVPTRRQVKAHLPPFPLAWRAHTDWL